MEKKFDSAEKILNELKKEKIHPMNMYLGFINSIYDAIQHSYKVINGAPVADFFIQGLIAITGDVESFKIALDCFMNINDMKN